MRKRDAALIAVGALTAATALKFLTRRSTVDWDRVADLVPHSEHSKFIRVDGLNLHYQEFGDPGDPTILLIHGYTASVYVWHTSAPMLAENGYHVIAVDLVGFGYSDKPAWFDYTIASQARVVARFLDSIGVGQPIVVGSSYGGAVAATLALDYPARVEKLVLVDSVINNDVRRLPVLRLAGIKGVGEVITPFLAGSKMFMRKRMRRTLSPASYHLISNERIANIQRPLAAADGHRSVLATSRMWDANRIEEDAHLISQPTLIVWGEDDRVIPVHNAQKLYDAILHSRLVVFKNCGHVPQEEKSDLFVEFVTEFCRDRKGRVLGTGDEAIEIQS
ncbi:MAG: alpha/beta hydrolase [Blastocatellia bacterium]|nr:alpha/beta hydrolase [Blastocatellia bacterium]